MTLNFQDVLLSEKAIQRTKNSERQRYWVASFLKLILFTEGKHFIITYAYSLF